MLQERQPGQCGALEVDVLKRETEALGMEWAATSGQPGAPQPYEATVLNLLLSEAKCRTPACVVGSQLQN
jgi:hypothetical protein